MTKALLKLGDNGIQMGKIKKALGGNVSCFVLITCSEPAKNGKMEVEMNYEGDESLAALLVDNAAQVFEARACESK